jgi:hypothetical protein
MPIFNGIDQRRLLILDDMRSPQHTLSRTNSKQRLPIGEKEFFLAKVNLQDRFERIKTQQHNKVQIIFQILPIKRGSTCASQDTLPIL